MPQLRVYRSFIKKAADSGKYLIIWDDKRRYEGRFKGFDPQGEFVILVDVLIKDENEEIESPEILIPIEDIKIVSTETEEERRKRLASHREVQTGVLMPGVKPETIAEISVPAPEKVTSESVMPQKEPKLKETEEPSIPKLPEIEAAAPGEEVEAEPLRAEEKKAFEELKPEMDVFEEKSLPEKQEERKEDTLVSVLESDVDTSVLSSETRELIKELSKKAALQPDSQKIEAPIPPETVPAAQTPTVEEKVSPQAVKSGAEVKTEATAAKKTTSSTETTSHQQATTAAEPVAEVRQTASGETAPRKAATTIIEEKSKKAASSRIFAEGKAKKPDIPKRKVDIATLILDILIVILGIVAIGILAVTFLGIKLPF